MQGDLEPGKTAGPLPPFVARPISPPRRETDATPLPPWTSQRRSLGASAPGTPVQPSALSPLADEQQAAPEAVREPWDEPYIATPDRDDEEALELDEVVVDEPWELQEPVPLEEEEEEELLLETSAMDIAGDEEPWLMEPAEASVSDEQPWGASEIEAPEEPWTYEAAEPETTEEVWTLESVDAGSEMEISSESWADQVPEDPQPPLASFPGEAEAWDAVAAAPMAAPLPDEERARATGDPAYVKFAERLESFAAELRTHGRDAVARGLARDRLSAALAGLIAGFEAAGGED